MRASESGPVSACAWKCNVRPFETVDSFVVADGDACVDGGILKKKKKTHTHCPLRFEALRTNVDSQL